MSWTHTAYRFSRPLVPGAFGWRLCPTRFSEATFQPTESFEAVCPDPGNDASATVNLTASQLDRFNEIRADGTRLIDSSYSGHFASDAGKWSTVTKQDLADLTDAIEATEFGLAGTGARNSGRFVDAHASLRAKLDHLRNHVWPKLDAGLWHASAFCHRELQLQKRRSDGDVEEFLIYAYRLGYQLRCQVRSTQPPPGDEISVWVARIDQGFRDRGVVTLADKLKQGRGADDDAIEPPGAWEAQSAYIDRRLEALLNLLRDRREVVDSSTGDPPGA